MERLNLCYGCMNPIDENTEVCPNCGYRSDAPHLPSYLKPGITLNDRYILGKLMSYNGESAVYIAFDSITETKVTIKEYMPDSLCSREKGSSVIRVNQDSVAQYKTLLSEFVELNKVLSKMRTLNHINAAIDMFGDNNTAYVVFSYLEGMTLGEYLKASGGLLTWDEVKKMFPPIFTTISLVHNAGLVHRGISPENIIITDRGELKLTGFCIADARTANTELVPEVYNGYAAPEQYSSNNWQGTWTDVYGISALLYRILTGVTPTDAVSRKSNDDLVEPAKINPSIPKSVSRVIMNGMYMNGELRVQTITELVTQLFEQPEYGSVRLSSSSTQTITIPKQYSGSPSSGRRKKNAAPSRHGLFIAVIAVILCVGAFMIAMIIMLDDTSGGNSIGTGIAAISGTSSDSESDVYETTTVSLEPMTETTPTTLATSAGNTMVYVMNDLTGKNYDIISNSDAYNNLVFKPEYEYNDEYKKGLIFEQSIAKNETYSDGAEILVKVSLGPKYITIPDYLTLNKKDYFAKLNDLGIKYEEQEELTEDTLEGYVSRTSKEPGAQLDVEAGEILTVYVAKNPPKTEPPETEPEPKPEQKTESTTTTAFVPYDDDMVIEPFVTDEPDIIITIFD
ncbi:MAG: PASTA domain-containing protein [Oscillospiraceae bacterium]|nr:PASTA domain-containing protein [Oscillospiraceae bacterium]